MKSVSKNFNKGQTIYNPNTLLDQKAVYHINWGIRPVAFLQNMQFRMIMRELNKGNFYLLERKQ